MAPPWARRTGQVVGRRSFRRVRSREARRTPRPVHAFSLIELLIVIAIIALLLTILGPVVEQARDLAKVTVCGANLRDWGTMAHAFAAANEQHFPEAYHLANQHTCFPTNIQYYNQYDPEQGGHTKLVESGGIPLDEIYDPDGLTGWMRYGASWEFLQEYGLTEESASCVGSENEFTSAEWDPWWGPMVYQNTYIYVAGIRDTPADTGGYPGPGPPTGHSSQDWGEHPAAHSPRDPRLADAVIAADEVFLNHPDWQRYRVNHPRRDNTLLPEKQNVLFGDGAVQAYDGRAIYRDDLADINPSYWHAHHWWGRFYWPKEH
jgi:prepilin-type N-terminal cleavage/methylation domain-containing protein